jgi:hypothetical protein
MEGKPSASKQPRKPRERESMEHLEMQEEESLEPGERPGKNLRDKEEDPLKPMEHYDQDDEER